MIQPGKYTAKALQGQLCEGSKNPYVSVELGISGSGETIHWFGNLSEVPFPSGDGCPADISIRDLLKMGWDGKDWAGFMGLGSVEVEIVVIHDSFEGKTRARIKYVNRPGERGTAKPVDPSKAKALQASLRGRVVAAQKELGATAPKPIEDDSFNYGANSEL